MRSTDLAPSGYHSRPSARSRALAIVLSLGIMALIVAALLRLGLLPAGPGGPGDKFTAIALSSSEQAAKAKVAKRAEAKPRAAIVPRPLPVPTPVPTTPPFRIIRLSKQEFAASDISGLVRNPAESASAGDSEQSAGAAYGPGAGPGGARLYKAEWHREPSNAELGGYLKQGAAPGSWALIACQTIDRYHVDNCRELDESPRGSGLARAMRLAAWQFLVRPPRLNGKPIPGAWVSIRISFTPATAPGNAPGSEEALSEDQS